MSNSDPPKATPASTPSWSARVGRFFGGLVQPVNKGSAEPVQQPLNEVASQLGLPFPSPREPEQSRAFDLEELLGDLAQQFQSDAAHAHTRLLFDTDTGLDSPLIGYPVMLRQSLANLLKSGCLRARPGQVVLTARATELLSTRVTVTFKIDESVSLPSETMHISPAEASVADVALRLAHQSAGLLGTHLEIFGAQGPGKNRLIEFKITCDKWKEDETHGKVAGASILAPPPADSTKIQAVIIEPDVLSRKVFKRMMGSLACSVQTAVTLQEAATSIRGASFQKVKHLVVIFHQDLKMSQEASDWKNLCEALESDTLKQSQISFVQLVDLPTSADADALPCASTQLWPLHTFALPQTHGQLAELIRGITLVKPEVKQTSTLRAPVLGNLRLLVVEDDPINQFLALTLLENEGASVQVASNGQQCLDMLRKSPRAFDLVLMDLEMPVLTGLEACRKIRSLPDLLHIPLISVTGHDLEATRVECMQAGFDDCLNKPLDIETLRNAVLKCVQRPRVIPRTHAQAISLQQGTQEVAILDFELALSRMGGDIDIFKSVAPQFPQHAMELQAQANAHLKNGDLKSCARALHSLKSVAGTMGAGALMQACMEAENFAARVPFDTEKIAQAIEFVHRILLKTIEALSQWESRTEL